MEIFWEKAGWQDRDKHLDALRRSPFVRPFPQISFSNKPALFIIRGPRQIGKSSWLKSILSEYPAPKQAFYLSCENIVSFHELSALLASLRKSRDLILLDEVSFVKDWTRSIKHEIDSGYGGTIIVTGSHAGDLRTGADQLPGRFGGGRELQLLPMSFDEFCSARVQAGWPTLPRLELLRHFFRVGGMPSSVAEGGPDGSSPAVAMDTYRRWIVGDALKARKNEAFLSGLLAELVTSMGSSVSLQTLAKKTEIASHHTVMEYIQFLEDCFALRTAYAIDPDTGAFRFRFQKKFYFTDPLLYWIALNLGGLPMRDDWEAVVAEMVGYEALARRAQQRSEKFGFFTSRRGEVDYFAPKRWAIELKWSPVAHNISPAYFSLSVPEKFVWTQESFLNDWPT